MPSRTGRVVITSLLTLRSRWNAVSGELGIREITLQIRRSKIMQQMQGASFADLARTAEEPDIPVVRRRR